jgi:beta-lactamase class A
MKNDGKYSDSKIVLLISLIAFAIGAFLVFLIMQAGGHRDGYRDVGFKEDRYSDQFPLISPLLECTTNESRELSSFDDEIGAVADELMSNGTVTDISYYFRDLNNGLWMGINEDEKFSPASLMKMPLMMSYLKQSEEDSSILDREYMFTNDDNNYLKQNIVPEDLMTIGTYYSVDDLIQRMIKYSDNSALRMLLRYGDPFQYRVFDDLDMGLPGINDSEEFMSVRDYSRFFRILYNASYLNEEYSNKALEILSGTQFKDGIVAGVPGNVLVSHKFGERLVGDVQQLHDCGIIYAENSPYVVCIMTRGSDLNRLSKAIEVLSKVTYEEVTRDK